MNWLGQAHGAEVVVWRRRRLGLIWQILHDCLDIRLLQHYRPACIEKDHVKLEQDT